MAAPTPPPDLEKAPQKWKQAFKALKEYAVATGLSKVIVTVRRSDGATVPAQVDMEQSDGGIIVRITVS